MHPFFKEFSPSFEQTYSESLIASKLCFPSSAKDLLLKASQKTEQRLKDEQKLVTSSYSYFDDVLDPFFPIRSKVKNV